MPTSPITIHLYGPDNEIKKTFNRSFIPWKVLKKAVKISKELKADQMTEGDIDSLADLVVAAFGDQFTVEELNDGAEVSEMMLVLNQVVSRASMTINPTPPPAR